MRWFVIFTICVLVIGVDQAAKLWVEANMPLYSSTPLASFFNFVHFRNTGAAFGFLSNPDTSWQLWFFLVSTVVALVAIVLLARSGKTESTFYFAGLGLIAGGAIGNSIDRLRLKGVTDFLDFHVAGYHWPAFNVADMAICSGVAIMLFFILRSPGTR